MTHYSIDVHYAYAQIGVAPGTALEQIRVVLADATSYRYSTRARIDLVRRLTEFFVARENFGAPDMSFSEIRKAWHAKVKALHPDKNKSDKATEDRLKAINAAYELVDKIHKEAKEYFRTDEPARREIEAEAKQATEREALAAGRRTAAAEEALRRVREDSDETAGASSVKKGRRHAEAPGDSAATSPLKYMAASLPRYIRHSRLYYLPRQAVIGSWAMQAKGGNLIYDVIMLPEREFRRAQLNLGIEGHGSPELTMSRLTPAYIPIDTRMVLVPEAEADPYQFAKNYFVEKFGLEVAASAEKQG